ncbi:unnamed protein product, partial [Discosporangium mesarthrocarpum]
MGGVRRDRLGRLRLKLPVKPRSAIVNDLPVSAVDDPNPFLPPSQYEVRLDASQGLGLSLHVVVNHVRVRGFSPPEGGKIGPAQACGVIQVGDTLVRVNHQELTLLSHTKVIQVLRSVLTAKGGKILLRFSCQDRGLGDEPSSSDPRQHSPQGRDLPNAFEAAVPSPRVTAASSPESEGVMVAVAGDDPLQSTSWHGARITEGGLGGEGRVGRGHTRSMSPPAGHMNAVETATMGVSGRSQRGGRRGGDEDSGEGGGHGGSGGGRQQQQQQQWGLWGERGPSGRFGEGGRGVYLDDMGHWHAKKRLRAIAGDVQVSPSPHPPLPLGPPRGRRDYHRRRHRARRRLNLYQVPWERDHMARGSGGQPVEGEGEEVGGRGGGGINLDTCREGLMRELEKLEEGMKEVQRSMTEERRRSCLREMINNIILPPSHAKGPLGESSAATLTTCPLQTSRQERQVRRRQGGWGPLHINFHANANANSVGATPTTPMSPHSLWEGGTSAWGRGGSVIWGEEGWVVPEESDGGGWGAGSRGGRGGEGEGGFQVGAGCELVHEAVPMEDMAKELLETHVGKTIQAVPPRPLPKIAFDSLTALEAVQHIATLTLAEVVQRSATGLIEDGVPLGLTNDRGEVGGSSEGAVGGGGGEEQGKDGWNGDRVGREGNWPPPRLTEALALVTSRQMGHLLRSDSEALLQV